MLQHMIRSAKAFALLTLLCGGFYPLVITGIAQVFFQSKANGSLIVDKNAVVVGSELIAQKFQSKRYFQGRPSAGDYATVASGASQLSPTSEAFQKQVAERSALWQTEGNSLPADLVTTSGSGLDPHISLEAALFQAPRVAAERNLSLNEVKSLIEKSAFRSGVFFRGQAPLLVNVLALNVSLDEGAL
jgi:potassium-transporting ATPase KdpC subunit